MALVDDDEIIVAPVQQRQVEAVALALLTAEVGVEKHIVAQAVFLQRVVLVVALVGIPVVVQLLRAQDENGLIAVLVVLDDRKGGEGLSETYAVREDTAVVGFQLVDDGQCGILLEVVELVPYLRGLETRGFVGQHIFADVLQELIEDVVEGDEIDEVRRILAIDILDVLDDGFRHIAEVLLVQPEIVEVLQVGIADRGGQALDELEDVVAALTA